MREKSTKLRRKWKDLVNAAPKKTEEAPTLLRPRDNRGRKPLRFGPDNPGPKQSKGKPKRPPASRAVSRDSDDSDPESGGVAAESRKRSAPTPGVNTKRSHLQSGGSR